MSANRYYNLINGEWVDSGSGRTFRKLNPADTRDIVGEFPDSSAEDTSAAVSAAKQAFKKWRLVPAPKRAEILDSQPVDDQPPSETVSESQTIADQQQNTPDVVSD